MKHGSDTIYLQDYTAPDFLITDVRLEISLHPTKTHVRSRLHIARETKEKNARLVLDGESLDFVSAKLNGDTLDPKAYLVDPASLTFLDLPEENFVLEIENTIDPQANKTLMGLYLSEGTYCTQCEAEGFRRITYYLDRPDVMARFTTRIDADKADNPLLLSNGNLIESGDLEDTGRHYAVWEDPFPKPAYLFALVAGTLDVLEDSFTTMSGRDVRLQIFVETGKSARAIYAMDALKRSMKWDEERYGREYDLDLFMIVAVSTFNMGAMENKGLNVFNDRYILANPETATDRDYANIEAIIAHEYFHNWTGNRITCRDWFQLCLKEGLTVFRDQEFSSDMRSRAVKRIQDVKLLKSHQFPEDAGPLAHPVRPASFREINNFYTATVYEKGAELVRVLHTLIGEEAFAKGMTTYFDRHDGQAVTIEDFVASFADANDLDLSNFLVWYGQAGTPLVTIEEVYDANEKTYTLTLTQETKSTPGQETKKPVTIPVRFSLLDASGEKIEARTSDDVAIDGDVLILNDERHSVQFSDVKDRPILSALCNFSAPVNLELQRSAEDLLVLLAHDPDPFNRWEAAQLLLRAAIVDAVNDKERARDTDVSIHKGLKAVLDDRQLDDDFKALMLTLPDEAEIAREIGENVDPEKIWNAHHTVSSQIADALKSELVTRCKAPDPSTEFSPDAKSAGRRALRNTALSLLAHCDPDATLEIGREKFAKATNMTDLVGTLSTIINHSDHQNAPEIEVFRSRYADEDLVLDKLRSMQAMVSKPETLDHVVSNYDSAEFDKENPNRVRSLVGAFCAGNQRIFHHESGAGYEFLMRVVLASDRFNPQLAARLLTTISSWKQLEPKRQSLAHENLKRLQGEAGLSKDVQDIVDRLVA